MQILFSKIIEQRLYVEKPQGFEIYHKETFLCRPKNILYRFKQLGAKALIHSRSMVKTFSDSYHNGYLEVQDDGLLIHDNLS
jgi:hypothetical protein